MTRWCPSAVTARRRPRGQVLQQRHDRPCGWCRALRGPAPAVNGCAARPAPRPRAHGGGSSTTSGASRTQPAGPDRRRDLGAAGPARPVPPRSARRSPRRATASSADSASRTDRRRACPARRPGTITRRGSVNGRGQQRRHEAHVGQRERLAGVLDPQRRRRGSADPLRHHRARAGPAASPPAPARRASRRPAAARAAHADRPQRALADDAAPAQLGRTVGYVADRSPARRPDAGPRRAGSATPGRRRAATAPPATPRSWPQHDPVADPQRQRPRRA